jgi:hypothetical protein
MKKGSKNGILKNRQRSNTLRFNYAIPKATENGQLRRSQRLMEKKRLDDSAVNGLQAQALADAICNLEELHTTAYNNLEFEIDPIFNVDANTNVNAFADVNANDIAAFFGNFNFDVDVFGNADLVGDVNLIDGANLVSDANLVDGADFVGDADIFANVNVDVFPDISINAFSDINSDDFAKFIANCKSNVYVDANSNYGVANCNSDVFALNLTFPDF